MGSSMLALSGWVYTSAIETYEERLIGHASSTVESGEWSTTKTHGGNVLK